MSQEEWETTPARSPRQFYYRLLRTGLIPHSEASYSAVMELAAALGVEGTMTEERQRFYRAESDWEQFMNRLMGE